MDIQELMRQLHTKSNSKIVMMVADGLGGLPRTPDGKTELETARTPQLDQLAQRGVQGASIPVLPGITPGSGPGHLALFGYDPLKFVIGRGALEATGVGFELQPGDVAVRCNFCTIDKAGNITDRRAGRISSEESAPLAISLRKISIPGVTLFVEPVKEHRFVVVSAWRGPGGCRRRYRSTGHGRSAARTDSPGLIERKNGGSGDRVSQLRRVSLLAGQPKANFLTMRGFAGKPNLPTYQEVYGLRAAAIAVYPMYKGLARLVGMEIVGQAATLSEEIDLLEQTLGRLRLLLRALQVHRQHRRRWQLRSESATNRGV